MFGGAWLTSPLLSLRHPCKSPASSSLGGCWPRWSPGKTRRCHSLLAPRLPRAHSLRGQEKTTWKWSLSSGRTAGRGTGSLPCCELYSRRETRHEIMPLSQEPCRRQRASIHKARSSRRFVLIHSNTSSTAPSPSSCDHVLSFDRTPILRISASDTPFSKYP